MTKSKFQNDESRVDEAILVYLGGTVASPGYQPIVCADDRLRKAYSLNYELIRDDIEYVMMVTMEIKVDWNQFPWPEKAVDFIDEQLKIKFPWMSSAVRRSLAAYYTYQWR